MQVWNENQDEGEYLKVEDEGEYLKVVQEGYPGQEVGLSEGGCLLIVHMLVEK